MSEEIISEPIMIIADYLDYSPSLYLNGPSRGVIEQAKNLWEKLKAKGYTIECENKNDITK